jgi:hypothetical protein
LGPRNRFYADTVSGFGFPQDTFKYMQKLCQDLEGNTFLENNGLQIPAAAAL